MLKTTLSVIALLCAVPALSPAANAANANQNLKNSVVQACQPDIQKYCSDVSSGGGKIMACLKSHEDKLSNNCSSQWQAARSEWKANMKAAHAACSGDVQKFCSDASTPMEVSNCLNQHGSDLSTACQNFRAQRNQG